MLAELLADPLDLVLLAAGLELLVPLAAALALGHPLLGERAVLDLVEDLLHLGLHRVGDDARSRG